MKITAISDLHGHLPELEGGDLLIVAGDLTASDKEKEYEKFFKWLRKQKYKKIIVVAGNHDAYLDSGVSYPLFCKMDGCCDYLLDSGIEFMGLNIWGSPWTKTFPGMNPKCKAFTVDTDEELDEKWGLIPTDTDILITHCPPFGSLDFINAGFSPRGRLKTCVGSESLDERVRSIKPKLHIFGHVHEGYGEDQIESIILINASHVNEYYEPVNKPIRIDL